MTRASELYGRPWSEREYIVVLHYYFQYRKEPRHFSASYIQNISRKLGRTPASIVMRMENFASIDPEVNIMRKGLVHANAFCRKVFKDWSGDLDNLRSCAEVFIRDTEVTNVPTLFEPKNVRIPKAFDKYELFDQIGQGE